MSANKVSPDKDWWTLKDVYRYYLVNSQRSDGKSAEQVIRACFAQRRFEDDVFQNFGSPTEGDRRLYDDNVKPLDELIDKAGVQVRRLMLEEAKKENWIALGRRSPDADHELIPPRYWPFLTFEIDDNAATGEEISFRDLRCRLMKEIAVDDPIRGVILAAQRLSSGESEPAATSDPVPLITDAPNLGATDANLGRNDQPGRPSFFHLVQEEFDRRRDNGLLEPSLTKQANALAAWFRETFPMVQPYQPKTIFNRLSKQYREARNAVNNGPKL